MWRCRAARQSWICLSHPVEMEKRHSLYLFPPPAVSVSCHHPSPLHPRGVRRARGVESFAVPERSSWQSQGLDISRNKMHGGFQTGSLSPPKKASKCLGLPLLFRQGRTRGSVPLRAEAGGMEPAHPWPCTELGGVAGEGPALAAGHIFEEAAC